MQGTGKSTEQAATWLDDHQYQMLFGEERDSIDAAASANSAGSRPSVTGTRWDRHRTVISAPLCPPAIPTTLDVRDTNARIELDIFADDRQNRIGRDSTPTRLQAPPIPPEFDAPARAAIAQVEVVDEEASSRIRTRAVSLAFAFGALAATIALWLIGVSIYY